MQMASRPIKKRKLTPPQSEDEGDTRSTAKIQKAFFHNAASWDLEEKYARKGKKKESVQNTRLPVKRDGRVQAVVTPVEDLKEDDEDWLAADKDAPVAEEEPEEQKPEEPRIPVKEQIRLAKEELSKLASALNEDPHENAGAFKALTQIGNSRIPAIVTLSLVTRMAIYKDLIPGYRIRHISSEDASSEKLSKEVRTIRGFEHSLVSGYQAYVKELARYAKAGKGQAGKDGISSVAITCAASLLTAHPHFNFRGDLIKILIWKLSLRRIDKDFEKAHLALATLFAEDEEGRASFEAVAILSRMMRAKDYDIHENVVSLFLHLRLLSEFSGTASHDSVDMPNPTESRKKHKKTFRTKRERKE
jgi:nucleolar complex protein 3